MPLDRATQIYIEGIAPLIAGGSTLEQIARQTDIPLERIQSLTHTPEFEEYLKESNPEAYNFWNAQRDEARVTGRVRSQAREDSFTHYLMLKELARNTQLKPEARASILRDLLRIGGQFKELDDHEERVELPPQIIQAWLRRREEMDE